MSQKEKNRSGKNLKGKDQKAKARKSKPVPSWGKEPRPLDEGFRLVLEAARAAFDESIDIAAVLGVDVKQSDQQVRGALTLPHGLGKKVRVLVFAKGEKEEEAKKAGADWTGGEDLAEKIRGGWLEFDRAVATPDMMPVVSKAARILGPKGLMPSPKTGSVTVKIFDAVQAEKKGKAAFRTDKAGIVHSCIGKKSMGFEKLKENYLALFGEIMKNKPSKSKGVYLQKVFLSSTMGPAVSLDVKETAVKSL